MKSLEKIAPYLTYIKFAKRGSPYQTDILIAIGLAIAISILTYSGTYQIPDPIFTDFYAQDVWFGSDIPTVFGNITSVNSDFGRNNKHPLFPLLVFPLVYGSAKFLNLEMITAVRMLIVVTAVVWVSSLYVLFRVLGCHRLDATLLSILGGVSAASVFWLVVPESFPLASVTIILGLIFAVLAQYYQFSFFWYVAINVVTVSITITNSMVGIFATLVNQSWKRIIQIGIVSLLLSTGLWMAQRIVFENSGFPFQPGTFIGEKKFVSTTGHSSILGAMSSFFYQTIVMPTVQFLDYALRPDWVKLDTNTLAPASAGWLGMVAVLAWSGLLLLGLWSFFSVKQHFKFRIVLGLTLVAQMAMHSIYGAEETFIYSLHFAPLLLTLVAFSLLTRLRLVSLVLITVLILSAGITNRAQFNRVTATLWNYGTPQQQVEAQMKQRPSDPWIRNEGQVILATTGSLVEDKAFHQPGGSFSPQPGSFGLSIWVLDAQGNLRETSDSIPLSDIQQQLKTSNSEIPEIVTKTPYYQTAWSASKPGNWQLNLERMPEVDTKPVVVIRSVGPAGGAINALEWDGQRVLINQRWAVKNLPAQVKVYLGSERSPDWIRQTSTTTQWQDERGWGYARLESNSFEPWQLEIEDLSPAPESGLAITDAATEPVLNLPNAQFIDSFKAQIAHLKMGLVGNQTRPGDPVDYPLPRLRDGAYQVVALARAGHIELAKQLIPYFAATDFTNGTQPAADIPAMGIWALTTVAEQVNQPDYDQLVWPDVHRKAKLILQLIASNRPGYPVSRSAVLPFSEHPDFIKVDLTSGEMAATPGLIALDSAANYMSYRALLDAAKLAERVKHSALAEEWRSQAAQLQKAWQTEFDTHFINYDETYITGLWPSWIAASNQETFKQGLEQRWQPEQDAQLLNLPPEHSNLTLSETHQWLYLNQPELVWFTVQRLWRHQSSPGLYTWGGDREPNTPGSLSQWHRFRGWMNPSQMTPHYQTAAEMLLLQLEMLAYINPAAEAPILTVGAGIPQDWLKQPLSIQGLRLGGNTVSWAWDGQMVQVKIEGQQMKIQLGDAFPQGTPVSVVVTQHNLGQSQS